MVRIIQFSDKLFTFVAKMLEDSNIQAVYCNDLNDKGDEILFVEAYELFHKKKVVKNKEEVCQ